MAFMDRQHRGPGRFLQWKIRLLAVGAVLLLVGMARDLDLLVIVAVAVLAAAFLLRFFEKEPPQTTAEEEDGDDYLDASSSAERWPPHPRETDAGRHGTHPID